MITEARYFGKSREISSAVDVTLCNEVARLNQVTMTAASKKVKAEDARHFLQVGGPMYFVINRGGGTNTFSFCDNGGNVLASVAANQMLTACLVDRSTANGVWRVRVRPLKT